MRDFGGFVLVAVGAALRFSFTDPDVPNLFPLAWVFMASGVAGILVEMWKWRTATVASRH